ncbi:NAD(P)-dependent alcohol dehydrogenase [Algoriphagus mannitolivorans]|uniref:NAD(P)-dependent alcohol dehydrogenase n=1 Tax=Algoriphagus mannitolivorans TaxID=226504 RepID=UPI000405AAB3|nr:NAD(P)-dependent alcohol dehydrogenase [Algoriphagus mannitolivorans]
MKASVRHKYCSPSETQILEYLKPIPKPGEVLIKVIATTVNRTDVGVLTGKPYAIRLFSGLDKPRIPITGTDFAGVVEEVGSEVQAFKPGDRVWGFNDNGAGTHAEYVCFPDKGGILRIPDGVDFQEMVACAEAAHYAVNFINKVDLRPGMEVLVNGGTGAIGSAAIQILKAMNIEVTTVCFEKDVEKVKNLGPDRVIALDREDFTKENKAYDFVFDAVGKSRFPKVKPILKPHGTYISSELGPNWENIWLALFAPLLGPKKVIFPIPSEILSSMTTIQNLVIEGKFKPLIDEQSFELTQIREAFEYVASGKKTGNVILKIQQVNDVEKAVD